MNIGRKTVAAAVAAVAQAREDERKKGTSSDGIHDELTAVTPAAMKVAEEEKEDSDANGHGDISNALGSEVAKIQQGCCRRSVAAGDAEADEHEGGRGDCAQIGESGTPPVLLDPQHRKLSWSLQSQVYRGAVDA